MDRDHTTGPEPRGGKSVERRRTADAAYHRALGEGRSWSPHDQIGELAPLPAAMPHTHFDFVSREGRRFSVSLAAEPVFELRRLQPIAGYVRTNAHPVSPGRGETRLRDHLSSAEDALRLESMSFRRGIVMLQDSHAEMGVMPLSWRMAISGAPFCALSSGLKAAFDAKTHVIAELFDIPAGVRRSSLRRVVSDIAERRRSVCARIPAESEALDAVRDCGFRGMVMAPDAKTLKTEAGWQRFAALIEVAARIAPTVIIDGAPPEQAEALTKAGATHAVFAKSAPRLI
ncbi:MAG TPA: hypothetical protein VG407_11895 [Caulobacteraceae bacterium]|jgi:hypothetical protein|nr:hypothetical protein [Caulobacteraceae bacterium]